MGDREDCPNQWATARPAPTNSKNNMEINFPKWLFFALLAMIFLSCSLSLYASMKRIRNEKKVRSLLDAGTVQVKLSESEITKIAKEIKQ